MNIEAVKSALISLAIRGQLVPQRDDEPAVGQLGEAPEEAPFEIPTKWKWTCLRNVCDDFIVPMRDKPELVGNSKDTPWCRIEDIEGKYLLTWQVNS